MIKPYTAASPARRTCGRKSRARPRRGRLEQVPVGWGSPPAMDSGQTWPAAVLRCQRRNARGAAARACPHPRRAIQLAAAALIRRAVAVRAIFSYTACRSPALDHGPTTAPVGGRVRTVSLRDARPRVPCRPSRQKGL